jgi:predicted RNase H-like HicB family nuclease
MKYAVVFEKTNTGYCAYIPDIDGCVAAGSTLEETRRLIGEAMGLHLYEETEWPAAETVGEMVEVIEWKEKLKKRKQ